MLVGALHVLLSAAAIVTKVHRKNLLDHRAAEVPADALSEMWRGATVESS